MAINTERVKKESHRGDEQIECAARSDKKGEWEKEKPIKPTFEMVNGNEKRCKYSMRLCFPYGQ